MHWAADTTFPPVLVLSSMGLKAHTDTQTVGLANDRRNADHLGIGAQPTPM